MSSMGSITKKVKLAISKAQKAAGQIPPDLASRVTALESADSAFDMRMDPIESLIASGHSGVIVVITGVDFVAQSTTTKTITITDGVITGVA